MSRPAGCSCPSAAFGRRVIGARWKAASAPGRRAMLPSVAGISCLLFFAIAQQATLVSRAWLRRCSLVTVPAAFLIGLLRSRLARGGLADLFRSCSGRAARFARPRSPARSATRRSCSPTACRTRRDTPTPTATRCWCRRSPPTSGDRAIRARRRGDRGAGLRRAARRRPGAGRGRSGRGRIALENERLDAVVAGAARRVAGLPRAHRRGGRCGAAAASSATCTTALSSGWSP